MNQALVSSLPAAHEPIPTVVVSVLNPLRWAPDVSVSAMPFALDTTFLRRVNWKRGRSGIGRVVCRTRIAPVLRDAHPYQVSTLTRASTFSWNGVAAAPVAAQNVDINVTEVG